MSQPTAPRSIFVLAFIWISVLAAGGAAAWAIHDRVLFGLPLDPPDPALARLQPLLAGETVEVPAAPGIWLLNLRQAVAVVPFAHAIGRPQRINLCEQRTRSPDDPQRLYPVVIGGDWDDFRAGRFHSATALSTHLRNPVAVPAAPRPGMPALTVAGHAPQDMAAEGLHLNARGAGSGWRLVTDGGRVVGADTPDNMARIPMQREAWLLWRKPGADAAQPASSFAYDHALRLRRLPHADCPAGVLEIELLRANVMLARGKPKLQFFPASGGVIQARLAVGFTHIPEKLPASLEDQALFNAAQEHELIRPTPDGRVEMAPRDLAAAHLNGVSIAHWPGADLDKPESRRLLKRLYTKADGRFVRQQIAHFNQERMWAAIRLRTDKGGAGVDLSETLATVDGRSVPLANGMPDAAARLFNAVPAAWGPWLRVANWPDSTSTAPRVHFRLKRDQTAGAAREEIQLLALGKLLAVKGATRVGAATPACDGPGCKNSDQLQLIRLQPDAGVDWIDLVMTPETGFTALESDATRFRHVQMRGSSPIWVAAPVGETTPDTHPGADLATRDGIPLSVNGQPTAMAAQAGLLPLVGVAPGQGNSVAEMLGRLGAPGRQRVSARLTIDLELQRLAHEILGCAVREGRWNSAERRCEDDAGTRVPATRQAGIVVMDADSGEILAAAGAPAIDPAASAADLIAFHRFNPGASPLRIRAWQHDGGVLQAAGSGFKIITALGLERAAKSSPWLEALLAGATPGMIDQAAVNQGRAFRMNAPCYPLPCGRKTPTVTNYHDHHPVNHLSDGRFGLVQALSDSLNTWFAMLAESSDATLKGTSGYPDLRPLGDDALDGARPIFWAAHALAFERTLRLDGGLLTEDFPWHEGDALQAMPSLFDTIDHRHEVRQHAIGLRMQVTPLQMATAAAAIGSGRLVRPYLLAELDGRKAEPPAAEALTIRLDRIRAGMKGVTESGTARSAFQSDALITIRSGVFAKTGTAPVPGNQNTAWFVGYVEPGTIPGISRRMAFAVFVTHTTLLGGTQAAPIIASLLETLVLACSPMSRIAGALSRHPTPTHQPKG